VAPGNGGVPEVSGEPTLLICLAGSQATEQRLQQIRELLASNPGRGRVLLRIEENGLRPLLIDLGPKARTDCSESTLAALRSLLGRQAVSLTAAEEHVGNRTSGQRERN
jgi:hypothetical protein